MKTFLTFTAISLMIIGTLIILFGSMIIYDKVQNGISTNIKDYIFIILMGVAVIGLTPIFVIRKIFKE